MRHMWKLSRNQIKKNKQFYFFVSYHTTKKELVLVQSSFLAILSAASTLLADTLLTSTLFSACDIQKIKLFDMHLWVSDIVHRKIYYFTCYELVRIGIYVMWQHLFHHPSLSTAAPQVRIQI